MEVEAETCTLICDEVKEVVVGYSFNIRSGVADRGSEYDTVFLQKIHSLHNLFVMTFSTTSVVGLRSTFDGEHEGDVTEFLNLLANFLSDEGGVGVDTEEAVIVLLSELEDIVLTNHRLTTGHHVEIRTKCLTFGYDLIHIFEGEVVLMTIGTGPASYAVHITSIGGIEEDQPGNVATILFAVCADGLGSTEESFVTKVKEHHMSVMRIGLINYTIDELDPTIIRIRYSLLNCFKFFTGGIITPELCSYIDKLDVGFGTFRNVLLRNIL